MLADGISEEATEPVVAPAICTPPAPTLTTPVNERPAAGDSFSEPATHVMVPVWEPCSSCTSVLPFSTTEVLTVPAPFMSRARSDENEVREPASV